MVLAAVSCLPGKACEIGCGDGIDAIEGGDVVVARAAGLGMQAPPLAPQAPLMGCITGQPERAAGLVVGERAGIDLRVVEAEDAAEGALELEAHHLKEIGVGGAEAVEQDDGVGDGGVRVEVVDPDVDAVVLAGVGLAGGGAEDGVDDGAVGVVDDGERVVGGCGRDVGGRGDLAGGIDLNVGAADVFVERAFVGEGDAGGGNGAPEGGSGVDHGRGLLVRDGARERTLIDVVVDLATSPVDGLAHHGGIEEGGAGDVFGSASVGERGNEREQRKEERGETAQRAEVDRGEARGRGSRDGHGSPRH